MLFAACSVARPTRCNIKQQQQLKLHNDLYTGARKHVCTVYIGIVINLVRQYILYMQKATTGASKASTAKKHYDLLLLLLHIQECVLYTDIACSTCTPVCIYCITAHCAACKYACGTHSLSINSYC
jgi:hypothetical protein